MDNRPIGVFDSGIGGLTVVEALANELPDESILYVGDTARVPYGNKSKDRIQEFSKQITKWLISRDCKVIVVACNTASSLALDFLRLNFNLPIIGVIIPGIQSAIETTQNKHIGVLGTIGTIKSDAYGQSLKKISAAITVVSQSCPLFVPLVEEGLVLGHVPKSIAKNYLMTILNSKSDTVILGCTHYPLLKPVISSILGSNVNLVDSGEATSAMVKSLLKNNQSLADKSPGEIHCFVTDSPETFKTLTGRFIKTEIYSIQHIDIT